MKSSTSRISNSTNQRTPTVKSTDGANQSELATSTSIGYTSLAPLLAIATNLCLTSSRVKESWLPTNRSSRLKFKPTELGVIRTVKTNVYDETAAVAVAIST